MRIRKFVRQKIKKYKGSSGSWFITLRLTDSNVCGYGTSSGGDKKTVIVASGHCGWYVNFSVLFKNYRIKVLSDTGPVSEIAFITDKWEGNYE